MDFPERAGWTRASVRVHTVHTVHTHVHVCTMWKKDVVMREAGEESRART